MRSLHTTHLPLQFVNPCFCRQQMSPASFCLRGVRRVLREMTEAMTADFLRWQEFDKSPRVANHSPDGVIEHAGIRRHSLRLQIRQWTSKEHAQRSANCDGILAC